MLNIEYVGSLDEELGEIIGVEFSKYAIENGVICKYKPFTFVAKESDEIIGVVTGYSYYDEVHIQDIVVYDQYRNNYIGSKLIEAVEDYYKHGGFVNINLSTYNFQAPDFYGKCGFQIEFVRENRENPKLNKYFFIKYF